MDHARPDGSGPGAPSPAETSPAEAGAAEASAAETSAGGEVAEPLHALFQRRVAGDDALLELARLRFTQTGLAAELYADTPGELEHVLRFVPPHRHRPMVHLNRGINLLHEQSRATVAEFAGRFAGRVAGLVVHDQRDMGDQTGRLLAALRELNARLCELPDGPFVFLEYAAHLDPGWYIEVAEKLQDAERVSCCIDIGHLGNRQASAHFARGHPGLNLRDLSPGDARLPELAADVQDAAGRAVADVLDVARAIGRLGKHLHFHLHDAHPLIPGLPDHFSFLLRLPVPFSYQGRRSLRMMYGPAGLAAVLAAAIEACGLPQVSFTLEIHQVEGRLPLADASPLFSHWQDTTNAERMNHWLSVLSENALLASQSIAGLSPPAAAPGP